MPEMLNGLAMVLGYVCMAGAVALAISAIVDGAIERWRERKRSTFVAAPVPEPVAEHDRATNAIRAPSAETTDEMWRGIEAGLVNRMRGRVR